MGSLYVAGEKPTAAKLNQYCGYADTTATIVTAASQTRLTTSYSTPADEPSVGSAYEIEFGGSGTWGSTQQTLVFEVDVGSVAVVSNVTIGNQAFAASASFRFSGRAVIVWDAIGSSGAVLASLAVNLTQTADAVQPPSTVNQVNLQNNNSIGVADANGATSSAIDTAAAQAFVVKAKWGSTTGAPTITNRLTVWKKVA